MRILTARNITKNCQQDVDQKVSTASALEEDTKRREDDGKNDLADIAMENISLAFALWLETLGECVSYAW